MHRRNYLALLGSGALGWWGNNQTTQSQDTQTTQTQENCTTATRDTPQASTTDTITASASQSGLVVDSSELTTIETSDGIQPAVDAIIRNNTGAPIGLSEITADWLDNDGNSIESSSAFIDLLAQGEMWRARIAPTLSDISASEVADYRLFVPSPSRLERTMNPDGIRVQSVSITTGKQRYIRGELINERSTAVHDLEAICKTYDSKGRVLSSESPSRDTLAAGNMWRLQTLALTYGRDDLIAESRITPLL